MPLWFCEDELVQPNKWDCEWHTHLLYDFVCPGTLNSEALLHHFSSNCIQDLHHTKIHSIIDIRTITYKYIYILYHFSQQFLVKHLSTNLLMISLKNLSDFRSSHLALNIQRRHFSHVRLASNKGVVTVVGA